MATFKVEHHRCCLCSRVLDTGILVYIHNIGTPACFRCALKECFKRGYEYPPSDMDTDEQGVP